MLTLPGWEKHAVLLKKIIALDIPMVDKIIAEFIYSPHWVNDLGAEILSGMIDKRYGDQVARALGLAGGIPTVGKKGELIYGLSWFDLPRGIQLMKQLILKAEQPVMDRMDELQFDHERAPWSVAMRRLPEFLDLPYISTATIKARLTAKILGSSSSCSLSLDL